MKVLVIGGTGTVGSHVVRELLTRGAEVSVLTRSVEKATALPGGARAVIGDLLDPKTVCTVFEGQDGVFLLNAVSATEAHEGLMGVNGARMAGVGRLAYVSVHNVDLAPHLPHFGSKISIEIAIKASGIPYTILRPNSYLQNDYRYKEVMLGHGVYPQPMGHVGLSRVDVRDIAEAAAVALTTGEHAGETYNVVGPNPWTGAATAEVWSRALGKSIAYGGDDLDAWEAKMLPFIPAWMVFDLRLMYAFFQEKGLKAAPDDIERLTKLLGHSPRTFEDFAEETAPAWKAES